MTQPKTVYLAGEICERDDMNEVKFNEALEEAFPAQKEIQDLWYPAIKTFLSVCMEKPMTYDEILDTLDHTQRQILIGEEMMYLPDVEDFENLVLNKFIVRITPFEILAAIRLWVNSSQHTVPIGVDIFMVEASLGIVEDRAIMLILLEMLEFLELEGFLLSQYESQGNDAGEVRVWYLVEDYDGCDESLL